MTATSISLCNFVLHSLVLGLLSLLVVRWGLRDARRRAHAAFLAVVLTLVAPWGVSMWPYPYHVAEAPTLTRIHQTLQTNWRIKVDLAPASPVEKIAPQKAATAPVWTLDKAANVLRIVWLAGFLLFIAHHLWATWKAWRWRSKLRSPTLEERATLPESVHGHDLHVFDHEGSPCVVGPAAPVIAVPASAFTSLTPVQWRWLLRHEGEHLRGGDVSAAWFLGWARAFGWWNPFLHVLIESFHRSREEVCDAAAMDAAAEPEPAAYAEFLLDMVSGNQFRTPSAIMPMVSSRPARRLRARLAALMSGHMVRKRLGWTYLTVCVVGYLCAYFFIASIGFTSSAEPPEHKTVPQASSSSSEDTTQIVRTFMVGPDFLTQGEPDGQKVTAMQKLKKAGVDFPEGASANFNAATSQLIIKNTMANLHKIEKIVEDANRPLIQIYTKTQFIEADQYFGEHGKVLSHAEAEELLARIKATEGATEVSAPSVTTRMDQKAMVEVVREGKGQWQDKFAGVRVKLYFQPMGKDRVMAHVDASLSQDPSKPLNSEGREPEDWSKVEVRSAEATEYIQAGDTLVLHLPKAARQVTVLVTVQGLAPDGSFLPLLGTLNRKPPPGSPEGIKAVLISSQEVDLVVPKEALRDSLDPLGFAQLFNPVNPSYSASKDKPAEQIITMPATFANAIPKEVFTIMGVFTDPQFQVVMRALKQRKDSTMVNLPELGVRNGCKLALDVENGTIAVDGQKLPREFVRRPGGGEIEITPIIGLDGYTIDLDICPFQTQEQHKVTTAVTIWDRQTVSMGGLIKEDELGKHYRYVFITARIAVSTPGKGKAPKFPMIAPADPSK